MQFWSKISFRNFFVLRIFRSEVVCKSYGQFIRVYAFLQIPRSRRQIQSSTPRISCTPHMSAGPAERRRLARQRCRPRRRNFKNKFFITEILTSSVGAEWHASDITQATSSVRSVPHTSGMSVTRSVSWPHASGNVYQQRDTRSVWGHASSSVFHTLLVGFFLLVRG